MGNSAIEWTDVTDNIIVAEDGGWWCRRISPGCDHCYAEKLNQNSFFGGNERPYRGAPPALKFREEIVEGWAKQRKSKKHFVSSMTDVAGEWVPRWVIFRYLDGMLAAPKQTFQLLTKRPEVLFREISAWLEARTIKQPPKNIWCGCTAENQEWADKRKPSMHALTSLGFITFVSYEPALGPVDWSGWEFVDQIISGGESGPGARPAHPDWYRATRDWCAANKKSYFHKQNGEFSRPDDLNTGLLDSHGKVRGMEYVNPDGTHGGITLEADGYGYPSPENQEWCWDCAGESRSAVKPGAVFVQRIGKKAAGRLLDGRTWDEYPEVAIA